MKSCFCAHLLRCDYYKISHPAFFFFNHSVLGYDRSYHAILSTFKSKILFQLIRFSSLPYQLVILFLHMIDLCLKLLLFGSCAHPIVVYVNVSILFIRLEQRHLQRLSINMIFFYPPLSVCLKCSSRTFHKSLNKRYRPFCHDDEWDSFFIHMA